MARHKHIRLNKSLGQHFLSDESVLQDIYDVIKTNTSSLPILEVGPGGGSLSKYLKSQNNYKLIEYDDRWVAFLKEEYPELSDKIIHNDFLNQNLYEVFDEDYAVVGNFPYNISSQIIFHVLDFKDKIPVLVGMFQKEVAERICSPSGTRNVGILSILTQLYYETEYFFDVPKEAFNPPPKVISGVMIMKRRIKDFDVDYKKLKQIVKLSFNQRRKTLRNSLKQLIQDDTVKSLSIFDKRPEELDLPAFINLTNILL